MNQHSICKVCGTYLFGFLNSVIQVSGRYQVHSVTRGIRRSEGNFGSWCSPFTMLFPLGGRHLYLLRHPTNSQLLKKDPQGWMWWYRLLTSGLGREGRSLGLRPSWPMQQILGQTRLCSKTLSKVMMLPLARWQESRNRDSNRQRHSVQTSI